MSDLISRSEAIQRFIQETVDSKSRLIHINTIKRLLQDAESAYNVDKVIEELELHSFELGTDTLPVHYVRLNEAIEIIKQGGVSDDICEWKQDNMCETVYRVCGGFSTTAYQTDFEFCPYCGKKIKVIQNDN